MITLKEFLAEPQTMYDGGMVQHMAEGGEPEGATLQPKDMSVTELRAEANRLRFGENEDYRMQHKAPTADNYPTGEDLNNVFPDIYGSQGKQFYGTGRSDDNFALNTIRNMRGNPNKLITVYRAVPENVNSINAGDFVTLTKKYAIDHIGDDARYKIIKKIVKSSELASDGNSIHEFGYSPPVPTEEGDDIVGYAGKAGRKVSRKVGKKALDIATKRVPGVGLISSSPAGEGSTLYTPEEMGMKLSAQRGIGETPTRAEQVEIRGGPLSKKLNEIQIGRILDDHNIDWEYHKEGGVTAVEKFSRGPDRKKYFRNNTSLKTIRNWLGYYKGGQVRPMYDGGLVVA
jgi:hypothetical protein